MIHSGASSPFLPPHWLVVHQSVLLSSLKLLALAFHWGKHHIPPFGLQIYGYWAHKTTSLLEPQMTISSIPRTSQWWPLTGHGDKDLLVQTSRPPSPNLPFCLKSLLKFMNKRNILTAFDKDQPSERSLLCPVCALWCSLKLMTGTSYLPVSLCVKEWVKTGPLGDGPPHHGLQAGWTSSLYVDVPFCEECLVLMGTTEGCASPGQLPGHHRALYPDAVTTNVRMQELVPRWPCMSQGLLTSGHRVTHMEEGWNWTRMLLVPWTPDTRQVAGHLEQQQTQ